MRMLLTLTFSQLHKNSTDIKFWQREALASLHCVICWNRLLSPGVLWKTDYTS